MESVQKIRVFSDIHLDFDVLQQGKNFNFSQLWFPEILEDDKESLLILAGDLWHAKKPFHYHNHSWVKELSTRFKYVVIVLGNHDFWGGNLQLEYDRWYTMLFEQNIENVFLLQNQVLLFGDLKIIGGTLWTDYGKNNDCMIFAEQGAMKDYQYIKNGQFFSHLKAKHILAEHLKTRKFIEEHAIKDYPEQKVWVISHHPPSKLSLPLDMMEEGRELDSYLYHSDLEYLFNDPKYNIDVWVHGHSHEYQHYFINDKKVIANPRGYTHEETFYNPWIVYDENGNIIE